MPTPVDTSGSTRYTLEGCVVTMDAQFSVLEHGVVYVDQGNIAQVLASREPTPSGFETAPRIQTRGTIYPGLIELHNHLSYNILPLWSVPKRYTNRSQWSGTPTYQKLISGPMKVLGMTPGYIEAVVRYVECKCLLGGVTTSQGIALFSNQGISRYYRGVVRNVEQTDEADLPEAITKIGDVEAEDVSKFLARLKRASCLILHLSEGIDTQAHRHFEALQLTNGDWAITAALSGIHCVGLRSSDFRVLAERGASMVWSPLSNLLLYGKTADIKAAHDSGVRIGIGSDWSPSGSKNLLGELKVARLVSQAQGGIFSDREIVAMAARNAAEILKWDRVIGTLEAGKKADVLVLNGRAGDPYAKLLESSETDITMVVINGVPRFGSKKLVTPLGPGTESWRVGSAQRLLNLKQETADPAVLALTLGEAKDRLRDGLKRLPELAGELESPRAKSLRAFQGGPPQWFLMLDHEEPGGIALRHHLPWGSGGARTAVATSRAPAAPLSQVLVPLALDFLTVADDKTFFDRLDQQPNLPDYIKTGLRNLY